SVDCKGKAGRRHGTSGGCERSHSSSGDELGEEVAGGILFKTRAAQAGTRGWREFEQPGACRGYMSLRVSVCGIRGISPRGLANRRNLRMLEGRQPPQTHSLRLQ